MSVGGSNGLRGRRMGLWVRKAVGRTGREGASYASQPRLMKPRLAFQGEADAQPSTSASARAPQEAFR